MVDYSRGRRMVAWSWALVMLYFCARVVSVLYLLMAVPYALQALGWASDASSYIGPWDYNVHPESPDPSYFIPGQVASAAMLTACILYVALAFLGRGPTLNSAESGRFARAAIFATPLVVMGLLIAVAFLTLFGWWGWMYTD